MPPRTATTRQSCGLSIGRWLRVSRQSRSQLQRTPWHGSYHTAKSEMLAPLWCLSRLQNITERWTSPLPPGAGTMYASSSIPASRPVVLLHVGTPGDCGAILCVLAWASWRHSGPSSDPALTSPTLAEFLERTPAVLMMIMTVITALFLIAILAE